MKKSYAVLIFSFLLLSSIVSAPRVLELPSRLDNCETSNPCPEKNIQCCSECNCRVGGTDDLVKDMLCMNVCGVADMAKADPDERVANSYTYQWLEVTGECANPLAMAEKKYVTPAECFRSECHKRNIPTPGEFGKDLANPSIDLVSFEERLKYNLNAMSLFARQQAAKLTGAKDPLFCLKQAEGKLRPRDEGEVCGIEKIQGPQKSCDTAGNCQGGNDYYFKRCTASPGLGIPGSCEPSIIKDDFIRNDCEDYCVRCEDLSFEQTERGKFEIEGSNPNNHEETFLISYKCCASGCSDTSQPVRTSQYEAYDCPVCCRELWQAQGDLQFVPQPRCDDNGEFVPGSAQTQPGCKDSDYTENACCTGGLPCPDGTTLKTPSGFSDDELAILYSDPGLPFSYNCGHCLFGAKDASSGSSDYGLCSKDGIYYCVSSAYGSLCQEKGGEWIWDSCQGISIDQNTQCMPCTLNPTPTPPTKNSCPFVYSKTSEGFILEGDTIVSQVYPFMDYPFTNKLFHLDPVDPEVLIYEHLDEISHIQNITLLQVEHPFGTIALSDPEGNIHLVTDPVRVACTDSIGADCTKLVSEKDSSLAKSQRKTKFGPLEYSQIIDNKDYGINAYADLDLSSPDFIELTLPRPIYDQTKLIIGYSNTGAADAAEEFSKNNMIGIPLLNIFFQDWFLDRYYWRISIQYQQDGVWKTFEDKWQTNLHTMPYKEIAISLKGMEGSKLRLWQQGSFAYDYIIVDYSDDEGIQLREFSPNIMETSSYGWSGDDYVLEKDDHIDMIFSGLTESEGSSYSYFLVTEGYYVPIKVGDAE